MTMRQPVYLHKPGMICALGDNTDTIAQHLFANQAKPLTPSAQFTPATTLPLGIVEATLPDLDNIDVADRSRNNQLLLAALAQIDDQLQQLKQQYPPHRIGIVLGTSTSGIAEAEQAVDWQQQHSEMPTEYRYQQQEIGAPAQFLARYLQLSGPATTISTACSSSAKALASARRLLDLGMCDAVICGGVDSLCRLTVNGFSALDSVSDETCQPFSRNRQGINIGEGACLFVMSHNPSGVQLSGVGETSDAHHISAPHPQGTGAIAAMLQALGDAQLTPEQVGYINLHGTATVQNDRMESLAVNEVFGSQVRCSSTKPLTGHTLGAAGAIEAGFCWLTFFADGRVPPQWWDGQRDDDIAELHLATVDGQHGAAPQHILSNSFAFGGNNIALILSANE
jgi:3-oxoacyl-[acyl-carrier-protein] synthase-1